jgi:hypothetical protein
MIVRHNRRVSNEIRQRAQIGQIRVFWVWNLKISRLTFDKFYNFINSGTFHGPLFRIFMFRKFQQEPIFKIRI